MIMYVLDQLFGVGFPVGLIGRVFGGGGSHCSFIVETVKVAPSLLEVLDPLLGLFRFPTI